MFDPDRGPLRRYGAALTATAVALLLRWSLEPWFDGYAPFVTLFAAVAFVAWYGGVGPAVLATIGGGLGMERLVPLPHTNLASGEAAALVVFGVYLGVCAVIILLAREARMHARRAERAVAELRAGQQLRQQLFDSLPMLIAHIGADCRYRSNNRAFELWFGRAHRDVSGKHMREVLGARAWERVRPRVERALAGETVHYETALDYQHGGSRQVSVTYVPQRDREAVDGFFVLVEDIGDRSRAELARAHLAAVVASSDDAIVSMTLDGLVTSWNTGAERLYGPGADEMLGQSIERLVPDRLRTEQAGILTRLIGGERIEHFETERVTQDGRRVPVSLSVSPIRDGDGRMIGVSEIARDITERRRASEALRESEEKIRKAFDTSPNVLTIMGRDSKRLLEVNEAFERLTGHARDQAVGRTVRELGLWADFDHHNALLLQLRTGHPVRDAELTLLTRHGGACNVLLSADLIDIDGEPCVISSWLDVTAHRVLEARLRESVERLAEGDRRKDEFLATLAHELRNPLAPILSAAQIMRNSPLDPALQRASQIIERQALHMSRLVDDLLDLARISRGRIQLRRDHVLLQRAIEAAVEACKPQLDAAGHRLQLQLPQDGVVVDGDLTRLAQVLGNLLGNAIKYTPAGGLVTVSLCRSDSEAEIRVSDSGIGIRPDMIERIFEMFTQSQGSLERSRGGLGIGLTLARQLIEMHGGTVRAFSPGSGAGSDFVVRLPLVRPAAPAARPATSADTAPASLRILLAEDSEDAAACLTLLLELNGHQVRTVHDGVAAVASAAESMPDVVLLDIGMPQMNGYDAARHIRALPAGAEVRLVALTGWGQEQDRRRAREAGFDLHLTKPVTFEVLQQALRAPQAAAEVAESM